MTTYHDLVDRFEAELKEKVDRAYEEVEREIEKLCRSCTHELVGDQCKMCLAIVRGGNLEFPRLGTGAELVGRYDHLKFQTSSWSLQTQRRCRHRRTQTPYRTQLDGLQRKLQPNGHETFYFPRSGAVILQCGFCGTVLKDDDDR